MAALALGAGVIVTTIAYAAAPVLAQRPQNTSPAKLPSSSGKNETPAVVLNDEDVASILGQPVFSAAGENMGRVVDILVDRKSDIRAAIIDFGGFLGVGSRKIAVDWRVLHFPAKGKLDRLIMSLSGKAVRLAPEYKAGEPIVVLGASASNAPTPPSRSGAPPAVPAK